MYVSYLPLINSGGGKLVIINKGPTPYDKYATFKFEDLQKSFIEINKLL